MPARVPFGAEERSDSTFISVFKAPHRHFSSLCGIIISNMSKVANYLQSHLVGEIYTRMDVREAYARDGGVMAEKPDVVVFPRTTNDIRKVARFAWQLAEKGHVMPLTACGAGGDVTGGNLSSGAILDLTRYMDKVYEYEPKQKLLRLQPGASAASVQSALRLHGAMVPALDVGAADTIGGSIAGDSIGMLSGSMGSMGEWVSQLEVVLDSGDAIQTGPITKRALNKLMGTQGREGDIYRGVDTILEDHKELITDLSKNGVIDRSGYPGIAKVRQKGGGIDLTPLFVGSQGTLGVIAEVIMRAEFVPSEPQAAVLLFAKSEAARDAADKIVKTGPSVLEYYDGKLYKAARDQGKVFAWAGELPEEVGAMLWIGYHSFNARGIKKSFKKLSKIAEEHKATMINTDDNEYDHLVSLRDLPGFVDAPVSRVDSGALLLGDGMYVPIERFEAFLGGVADLEKKLSLELPIEGSMLSGIYRVHPSLSMKRVSDKQKVFKLLDGLQALLAGCDGSLVGAGGEGRLLGRFTHAAWEDEYRDMMTKIKQVFDPHGLLNPAVKQPHDLKVLANSMASDNPKRK